MKNRQNNIKSITSGALDSFIFRSYMLRFILAGFVFFVLFYLFLLGTSVMNIVERKSLEAEAHLLANQIGELELEYLQMSNSIDRQLSAEMGFKEIAQHFAVRKSANMISKKLAKNEI